MIPPNGIAVLYLWRRAIPTSALTFQRFRRATCSGATGDIARPICLSAPERLINPWAPGYDARPSTSENPMLTTVDRRRLQP